MYYGVVASDQYISEARFSVRSGEASGGILGGIGDLIGAGQSKDALVIADYIESRSLIDGLQNKLDVRGMFSGEDIDFLAKSDREASAEEFLKLWKRQVDVSVDRNSGLATLRVRAFSPQHSLQLTNAILELSEGMVNNLTRRNEQDAFNESRKELDRAKAKLEAAVSDLRDERNRAGVLDATITAKAYGQIITALRLELSEVELSITGLMRTNAQESPQLTTLHNRANSLRQQVQAYEDSVASNSVVGSPREKTLAVRATALREKEIELNIAQLGYKDATTDYEKARLAMEQQRAYLLTYVAPRLAEESLYPKRLLMVSVLGVAGFLLWAVVAGIAVLVRDHMAP